MNRPTPRKSHLMQVAFRLFNEFGYHNTGVDLIMKASGVSKTTLYKHFPTKEALIEAVLDEQSDNLINSIELCLQDKVKSGAAEKVTAIVLHYINWLTERGCKGCPFMKASAEYQDPDNNIVQAVQRHYQRLSAVFEDQWPDMSEKKRIKLIRKSMLLAQGVLALSLTDHGFSVDKPFKAVVKAVFDN